MVIQGACGYFDVASPATDTGQATAGAWSGSAFIWSIVVIMVVLGVIL